MTQYCPNPFEWLDISAWGSGVKFSLCVESWAGEGARLAIMPFGEAADMDISELWNGEKAQAIRLSAITCKGQPTYCGRCPKWETCDEPVATEEPRIRGVTSKGPKILNLAYDHSCNLACPSCRTERICHLPSSPRHGDIQRFQDNVIRPLLKNADRAYLAGLGDPFGSPCYWELLSTTQPEDVPTLKWAITTNGQLFTPERYHAIPTRKQIDMVHISIDAATPETYRLNRNGKWDLLIAALSFAGALRRSYQIDTLEISMVTQQNNYREAVKFVQLASNHSVDTVKFSALLAQGTFTDSDYLQRAVHIHSHPEFDAAIKAIQNAHALGMRLGINVTVEGPR